MFSHAKVGRVATKSVPPLQTPEGGSQDVEEAEVTVPGGDRGEEALTGVEPQTAENPIGFLANPWW